MKNFYTFRYNYAKSIAIRNYFLVLLLVLTQTMVYAANTEQIIKEKKVTINAVNERLDKILSEINAQTKIEYGYQSNDDINKNQLFTLTVKDVTVEVALNTLFKNSKYSYRIVNNKVVVFVPKVSTSAPQKRKTSISGTVLDKTTKAPLVGATVMVNESGAGAITDDKGAFLLITEIGNSITISCVGMVEYKYTIPERNHISVFELNPSILNVDDVVITGYQVLSARESASAVTSVKAEDVLVSGVNSLDQMLQGKVAGMMVMNTSGEPSATPKIRVRGNSTISGNKAPVWVLDGVILEQSVPFNASDINSEDAAYLIGNAIAGVNPQDIETITVLKDASATAIYGVKAANGVIVVTTKKGSVGPARISYAGDVTVNQRPSYSNFDRMDATQRMQLSKEIYSAGLRYPRIPTGDSYESLLNQMMTKVITPEQFEERVMFLQNRNTDWFKEIFRTQVNHSHSLNVSGGTEKVRYYFSFGYNNSQGAAIKSQSERFTGLGKIDVKFNKFIDFTAKVDFNTTENNGYHTLVTAPFDYAYKTSRTLGPYNEDGTYMFYDAGNGYLYNYLSELNETGNRAIQDNLGAQLNLKVKLFKGLAYTGTFAYSKNNSSQKQWATERSARIASIRGYNYNQYEEGTDKYMNSPLPYGGLAEMDRTNSRTYTVRNDLNYNAAFGKHTVNAMAGMEVRSSKYDGVKSDGYGWTPDFGESFTPIMTDKYISSYITRPSITNSITQVASFFGTLAYTYDGRYVVNGNIRSDGANKFGSNPKYRWLPTWSVAGKWILSSEKFMKNQNVFDLLAIRASYGIQGNIHDDATPDLIVKVNGKDGNTLQNTSSIVRLPNPDLRWEKTKSWNAALDFTLFKGRLKGSIDVYGKNTSDLILSKQVSSSNGRSFILINAGEMTNFGFEGNLYGEIIKSKNFDWSLSVNFGRNVNEVTLANGDAYNNIEEINKLLAGNLAVEGAAVGSMFSYRYEGLSGENGYPLFRAKDGRIVHEGEPILLDLVNSGSIFPLLSGGLTTDFKFKRALTLTIGLTYNIGGVKRLPTVYEDSYRVFDPLSNVSTQVMGRWKQKGDENFTSIPALIDNQLKIPAELRAMRPGVISTTSLTTLYNYCDDRVAKSDYIRLRLIAISYDIPSKFTSKFKISYMKVRFQATDLGVLASNKWKGLDPEMPSASIPLLPTFSLGVNVSF